MTASTMEKIELRQPTELFDVAHMYPLLDHLSPNERNHVKGSVIASIDETSSQTYLLAERGNNILGVMGIKPVSGSSIQHAETSKPFEVVNTLLPRDETYLEIGKVLFDGINSEAHLYGVTELVIRSDDMLVKNSTWAYWNKQLGAPLQTANGVSVWRTQITA